MDQTTFLNQINYKGSKFYLRRNLNSESNPPTDPTLSTMPEWSADRRFAFFLFQFLDRPNSFQTNRHPRSCTAERQILPHFP
jgi:hypothetical protein